MTTRYEARVDHNSPNRVVLIDRIGHEGRVVDIPAEWDDAFIARAQAFLEAGIARFGSLDEFDRACRWMNDLERSA